MFYYHCFVTDSLGGSEKFFRPADLILPKCTVSIFKPAEMEALGFSAFTRAGGLYASLVRDTSEHLIPEVYTHGFYRDFPDGSYYKVATCVLVRDPEDRKKTYFAPVEYASNCQIEDVCMYLALKNHKINEVSCPSNPSLLDEFDMFNIDNEWRYAWNQERQDSDNTAEKTPAKESRSDTSDTSKRARAYGEAIKPAAEAMLNAAKDMINKAKVTTKSIAKQ